jgi:uncharacterized protein YlaN (UPF0358 family)
MESVDVLTVCVVEVEVEAPEDEAAVLLVVQTDVDGFEDVLLDVHGLLDDQVYGVLVEAEEVLHFELVDSEEVLDHQVYGVLVEAEEVVHFELVDFEDVVHFELVEDVLEEEHLVEVVFDEEQGVEVVLVEVQGVEVVFEDEQGVDVVLDFVHLVDDDSVVDQVYGLVEVKGLVQRLLEDEDLVQRLLDVVGLHPEEHDVLVKVVAGVQVQVLQLVVTTGFPAVVMR